jgi:CHAT domain-containing protein
VVLSRWPEGGQSAATLIRELVRELPNRPASRAWQRAIRLVMASDLIFADEPRVKRPPEEADLKTDHPFFWAGYLLVDRGVVPK